MSCRCNAALTVRLNDERYPVAPAAQHTELSYWFDARCVECDARYEEPYARVDESGVVLAEQTADLPLEITLWFREQCGPFTCGCDQEELHPAQLPSETS
ncbi:hypothetical protein [Streptomyces sp. NPDC005732]|uniref:hypothetical protein n=1 Tax=Streptomyces sp. NPDC005732 TaxID=3157057 RepID=UPI0033D7A83D